MRTIRKSADRGHFDHGWLDTYHSFSFGEYDDPAHRRFRSLRVINEDFIQGGVGFPMHGHRDMEIVTYVLEGALQHRDSMGNGAIIPAGEVQRMSAGSGIMHSEFNASATDRVHLLQIWIIPAQRGLAPGYEQRPVADRAAPRQWLASPDGRDGSVTIHQDAFIGLGRLSSGEQRTESVDPARGLWLQVVRGALWADGMNLTTGDGLAVEQEKEIHLTAAEDTEYLLFDLA